MANEAMVEAVSKIYEVLSGLDLGIRARVMKAVDMLLGTPETQLTAPEPAAPASAQAFFDEKMPKTKMEELAVAARYRELIAKQTSHSQRDLRQVMEEARRNFDVRNFPRDLENARSRSLFNRGTGKDRIILSYHGQNYVDHLPDRQGARRLRAAKVRSPRKPPMPKSDQA